MGSIADVISPKEIHEARQIRDAEDAELGIVRRVLEEALAAGEEPTNKSPAQALGAAR